jgi:hypothetical protein
MESSGNSNLVVGPDGAIYCMIKPPVYNIDSNKLENGNPTSSQMSCHPQMATALGMSMNLSMGEMWSARAGGPTLINPVVNMGNKIALAIHRWVVTSLPLSLLVQ